MRGVAERSGGQESSQGISLQEGCSSSSGCRQATAPWPKIPPKMCLKLSPGSAAVVRQDHEDKQHLERDRGNHKEVGRDESLDMILKKGAPRPRGWLLTADHVLRNRGLRDFDPELQELPMDARGTLAGVGYTHSPNEISSFAGDRRTTLSVTALPSPIAPKSLSMPCYDRFGFDD